MRIRAVITVARAGSFLALLDIHVPTQPEAIESTLAPHRARATVGDRIIVQAVTFVAVHGVEA